MLPATGGAVANTDVRFRHSPGTASRKTSAGQGQARRSLDRQSCVPAWPRLLNIEQAAIYLGVSREVIRELINSGQLAPVRVPRPDTIRMHRRAPVNDTLRRLLLDRVALDELVDRWRAYGD